MKDNIPIREQTPTQDNTPIHEKTISSRRGRPTKYTKETPRRVMHYIKKCQENNGFPTIERLAAELAIGIRTLYTWEAEYSDFRHVFEIMRDVPRDLLICGDEKE